MFPWVAKSVQTLSLEDKQFLQEQASFVFHNIYEINLKTACVDRLNQLLARFIFLQADLQSAVLELDKSDYSNSLPKAIQEYIQTYCMQFLHLPKTKRLCEDSSEIWYVLHRNKSEFVLGKVTSDSPKSYTVDAYKDASCLKSGWTISKDNNRIISVLTGSIKAEDRAQVLSREVDAWFARMHKEGKELAKKFKKRVLLATHYFYGTLLCVVESEDANAFHLAIYDKGVCVNSDWLLEKSCKKQILQEIL